MSNQIDEIIEILNRWKNGGKKKLSNGTELICHVPHVAPEAWLHEIYAPLSKENIESLENAVPLKLPQEYKEFLLRTNGINIFSDSLSIWGLRKSYSRSGDEAIQPYDVISMNKERPKNCPDTWLFFAGYSWDGTRLFFDLSSERDSGKVYRCERYNARIIQEWPSLGEFLTSEVERLSKLFDEKGVEYDENMPTCPSNITRDS